MVYPPPPPPPPPPPQILNSTEITIRLNDLETESERDFHRRSVRLARCFILFLVAFLLLINFAKRPDEPYSYFVLAKVWPPGKCYGSSGNFTECRRDTVSGSSWAIDGFRTKLSNHTCKTYCARESFDIHEVDLLRPALIQNWPSFTEKLSEPEYWTQEWVKHGTCSRLDQFTYFARALSLHGCHDVGSWLAESGILPQMEYAYNETEFKAAIARHVNPNALTLGCVRHKGQLILTELRLCILYQDAQTLIPCPVGVVKKEEAESPDGACLDRFYYVPF